MKVINLVKHLKYEILFVIIFVLARLPFLGQEMFNTDVWKWKARIYDFGSGVFNLDFDKTLQKYHPGVTLMWIGTVAVKFEGLYCSIIPSCPNEATDSLGAIFNLHFFQKFFIILTLGLTLAFAFYPLRKLFGEKYAFVAMFLLTFEPFFYALTRVIHLEALMTSFMLTSFVWLFYTLETAKENRCDLKISGLVLSAVFTGLAVLTKSTAVVMLPLSLLSIVIYQRNKIKLALKTSIIWLAPVILTYFVLWPAMWVHPLQTLDYVFIRGIKETGLEGEHTQIFLGKYTENPGPLYYFVVMAFKFSPLLVTGIVFFAFLVKRIKPHFGDGKAKRFVLLTLLFALGYLLEITIPTKKLDRYILPTLGWLTLLAGFFYTWLLGVILPKCSWGKFCALTKQSRIDKVLCHFSSRASTIDGPGTRDAKSASLVVLTVFMGVIAYQSLPLTPDYFSYYSPLAGGPSKGIYALEPKCIIGQHQIASYFVNLMHQEKLEPFYQGQSLDNQKDLSRKLTVAFPEKYYTQIWPFVRRLGGWATIEDLTGDAKRTKYFVYPVWDDYSNKETRFTLTYKDSIYLRGVKLYNVYQRYDL